MYKLLMLILCLVILATSVGLTYAQDSAVGSKEDNACNEGGALAGKCDSPWAWVCGWYLARLASNTFTRGQVIDICASVLSPLIVDANSPSATTGSTPCLLVDDIGAADMNVGNDAVFWLFTNDCGVVVPITHSIIFLTGTLGTSMNFSTGEVGVLCNNPGAWVYIFTYTDGSGRTATANFSGNCF